MNRNIINICRLVDHTIVYEEETKLEKLGEQVLIIESAWINYNNLSSLVI